jgi:hypothetical protein
MVERLTGILPGTQFGLSNRLAGQDNISNSTLAASPLGFAADSFYNWGYAGPLIVSALCALVFLLLDIVLTESRSALAYAAKTSFFSRSRRCIRRFCSCCMAARSCWP